MIALRLVSSFVELPQEAPRCHRLWHRRVCLSVCVHGRVAVFAGLIIRCTPALDAACDWGLNCGNSELQLRATADAAYLAGSADLLKAAAEQMCTCVASGTFLVTATSVCSRSCATADACVQIFRFCIHWRCLLTCACLPVRLRLLFLAASPRGLKLATLQSWLANPPLLLLTLSPEEQ